MQKITSCLWFDGQAEEAAKFYTSVFKNSKIGTITYYGDFAPKKKGQVLTVEFELDGEKFLALNGGPEFKFTEAISLMIDCETQEDVDYYWEKLTEGGKESRCGWLKDKYGLSWQVVPTFISKMMKEGSTEQFNRVMNAVMEMVKLDIKKLEQAYEGK